MDQVAKICFFTGARAEYWLLRPLMQAVAREPDLSLQLVVSGMHLSPEYGLFFREIVRDGFPVVEPVEILLSSDSAVGTCKSMGLALISVSEVLARLAPDLLVVLGDRFETFAAASCATILSIPLAHLHGGELTRGAYDDSLRHAITKMSHLHFAATDIYRHRIIQLGEDPATVFNVGAIGVESAAGVEPLSRQELEARLGFSLGERSALVTFHPVTREQSSAAAEQMNDLLAALESLAPLQILFTGANADAGGREINQSISGFIERHPDRAKSFASLGQQLYFSALRQVDVVIGNSSSGVIEAPSFGVPVVNIGDRQGGRVHPANVIDCAPDGPSIREACRKALTTEFRGIAAKTVNPYEQPGTVARIVEILKARLPLAAEKGFYDLPGR